MAKMELCRYVLSHPPGAIKANQGEGFFTGSGSVLALLSVYLKPRQSLTCFLHKPCATRSINASSSDHHTKNKED